MVSMRIRVLQAALIASLFRFADSEPHGESIGRRNAYALRYPFKTEPEFKPIPINVDFNEDDDGSLGPGYIFIANMEPEVESAPHIYTPSGELVWYGKPVSSYRTQDFRVCDVKGTEDVSGPTQPHLCWTEREPRKGGKGPLIHKIFLNSDYTLMKNISGRGDVHEFQIVDKGSAYVTMEHKKVDWDLSIYTGPQDGSIRDACILDYNIGTGKIVYEWCYSDYLPLWQTDIFFGGPYQTNKTNNVAGKGTHEHPWDYAHMNSVDKNEDGDYIASIRHLDQVIKVAGPNTTSGEAPGTVLWRLGGNANDFEMDFNFTKQHDVKYLKTDGSQAVLSMFDNAWDGWNDPSANASSGKLFRVDNETMQAHLLHEYPHPGGNLSAADGTLSGGRGGMQVLDNGNVFIGWGKLGDISEFSHDGRILYHATYGTADHFSYRAYKHTWTGNPTTPPKLLSYTPSCSTQALHLYASWNGATEVSSWRVYISYSAGDPWLPAGTYPKTGFETYIKLDTQAGYASAEALDSNGTVMASVISQTFIPGPSVRKRCGKLGCRPRFPYDDSKSIAGMCQTLRRYPIPPLVVLALCIELLVFLSQAGGFWLFELVHGEVQVYVDVKEGV